MNNTTNLSYLKSISDNDNLFVEEMINTFLEQTPDLIAEMKQLVREKNCFQVGRMAHRMKPSLTFMGMIDGQRLIKDIEYYSEDPGNCDKIIKLISMLQRECEIAYNELSKKYIA
ncbi:MAG: Hpt domain-containing protein [Cyclobacteriaceae bacterium]